MMEDSEDNHLDESLRNLFSDFHLPPTDQVWTGIEQRLQPRPGPPPRRRPRLLPVLLPLVALLSFVGGWLWPHTSELRKAPTEQVLTQLPESTQKTAAAPVDHVLAAGMRSAQRQTVIRYAAPQARPAGQVEVARSLAQGSTPLLISRPDSTRHLREGVLSAPAALASGAPRDSLPTTARLFVTLERLVLHLRDSVAPAAVRPELGSVSREQLLAALRAEQAELSRLRHRNDSLLLALGTVSAPSALSAAPQPVALDTARLRSPRRWSVLLTMTPEQNHQRLQTAPGDTLLALRRHQEGGRQGLSAAVLGEYQLNQRVSVGLGLGYTRAGAELRVADQRTDVSVRYDTTISHTVEVYTSTHSVYSVRVIQIPQLNPVFNSSGQVIRYDTVYINRNDTLRTVIVQNDTVRNTRKLVTPLIDKRETTTYRTLKPIYHFFTVPVQLRYRLTPPSGGRWWADATVGAQIQLFLGGSQLVTEDGHHYRTERVRVAQGPFRPLNLAFMGSLALNYSVSRHLSLSVAPALRWQALSVYKASTGLRQQSTATGLQLGVRWQF